MPDFFGEFEPSLEAEPVEAASEAGVPAAACFFLVNKTAFRLFTPAGDFAGDWLSEAEAAFMGVLARASSDFIFLDGGLSDSSAFLFAAFLPRFFFEAEAVESPVSISLPARSLRPGVASGSGTGETSLGLFLRFLTSPWPPSPSAFGVAEADFQDPDEVPAFSMDNFLRTLVISCFKSFNLLTLATG